MKSREPLTTRIIGGKYKGRKIVLPEKSVTRSSKSRLRESVFNTLQFEIVDRGFIEMFGGSGSVGLEAVSRGASKAWFIETDKEAHDVLRQNCRKIDPARCDVRFGDAFSVLPRLMEEVRARGERVYLYIDPPFSIREGHEDIYKRVVETIAQLDPTLLHAVIVEHMTKAQMPERIGPFVRTKHKKFGKSSLSYYHWEEEVE